MRIDYDHFQGKKILVTGGAGFIGSSLVKVLVRAGAQVHVIDNLWRGSLDNLRDETGQFVIDPETNLIVADLACDGVALEFIRDYDLVYHLADVVAGIRFVFNNELFLYRKNILINSNCLNACVVNGIPNYVYVGTACSYPKSAQMKDSPTRFSEDDVYPAEPESSYGWSKLMGEYEAELAQRANLLNVGLLRFHNVYGPGSVFNEKYSQVLPALARKAARHPKERFVVWGSGEQSRDFVFISDVVNALLLVATEGMNQGVIQIGSGSATTIRQAAEMVVKASGKTIDPCFDTSAPEGDRGRIADYSKARRILGWTPEVDIESGLQRLYEWVEKRIVE